MVSFVLYRLKKNNNNEYLLREHGWQYFSIILYFKLLKAIGGFIYALFSVKFKYLMFLSDWISY